MGAHPCTPVGLPYKINPLLCRVQPVVTVMFGDISGLHLCTIVMHACVEMEARPPGI